MKIKFISGKPHYYDDNGEEIHEGDTVLMNGKEERVYLTQDECLGTDATNPKWIENGRAVPCEYGIYPFNYHDSVVLVRRKANEVSR